MPESRPSASPPVALELEGYEVRELLYESERYSLYRVRRGSDDRPLLLKVIPGSRLPFEKARSRMRWEHEVTCELEVDGVAAVQELIETRDGPALVLDDRGEIPLTDRLTGEALEPSEALPIAARLAEILAEVHGRGIVHRAIRPENLLVGPNADTVRLTGFDLASRLPDDKPEILQTASPAVLAYLAPEQTGRMNRRVGVQSDLYSVGVILYEMLTGRLPFENEEPLELMHAHIARDAEPPDQASEQVDASLAAIVMKLLAKAAEDRYRTARGLRADLDTWVSGQAGKDFAPGQHDISDQLVIPERLYGREPELAVLMDAFERVGNGASELLLVRGYSGIGKSSLVQEAQKPIVRRRGHFVGGKFDQFKRNIPHSAIIGAFRELTRQLLAASDDDVEAWRQRLRAALGDNGQVIVNVIPEVEWIIGPQPPVPDLLPTEQKNRFDLVFESFIKVFAQAEHPLVLFLDDLQWADNATLVLIRTLTTDPTLGHLLIIGAYRDNEVGAGHPLSQTIKALETTQAHVSEIHLGPLRLEHLERLVADSMHTTTDEARDLAELVHGKTAGNPFFVVQFLRVLWADGLVRFDESQRRFVHDADGIRGAGITDNVVDLMLHRIRRLPESAQSVLTLAACIGNTFDLSTLGMVLEATPRSAARDLRAALLQGVVLPLNDAARSVGELSEPDEKGLDAARFRFLHDRVQQAAYALIPDDSRQQTHLRVGRLILANADDELLEERLFEVVGHLNDGAPLITDPAERVRVAELNGRAGRKAKEATAYDPALAYFEAGLSYLPEDPWADHYAIAFALALERADCAYLCGDFPRADRELDALLERATSPLEKAEIYRMRIVQYENTSRFAEARDWGKTGLALFDITFPEDEAERQRMLAGETAAIEELIGERQIESLVELPEMSDPSIRICMKLLMTMWAPSYISGDMFLTALIAAKMVHLSLRFGNVQESAYGYVIYAATVALRRGDYRTSYDFGRLALAVNAALDDLGARAKVHHMFSCYIGFWRQPIAACFPHSREAHQAGLASGDLIYAAYGVFHESWHALFSGQSLPEFESQYGAHLDFMTRTKNETFHDAHQLVVHWGRALMGRTGSPTSLSSEDFDEAGFVTRYVELDFFLSFYYVAKLQLLYLFGELDEAAHFAARAAAAAPSTEGMIWDTWSCFYSVLTLTAQYPALEPGAQAGAAIEIDRGVQRMAVWAESCPENFEPRHALLQAEAAAVRGDTSTAMAHYERAIRQAERNGFIQIEALANERYGKWFLARGNAEIARLYLRAAHRCYRRWGAAAKAESLERDHPQYFPGRAAAELDLEQLDEIDVATVLQAARVLSGEVRQRRLWPSLLRIVLENAGAQRGALILKRDTGPVIAAERDLESDAHGPSSSALDEATHLAASVIHYVSRVGESVVLADANRDGRFTNDPYIQRRRPLSILCLPIRLQGKPLGVLYLENNLVRGAFTPDRIQLVSVLAGQAAIALENARLYEEMRQEIAERRRAEEALRDARKNLERRVADRTRELSRANRAKTEFLASMSHELRTPLNAILGYAQILRADTTLSEGQRRRAEVIVGSGDHLLTLINDILSLSKIEAGKLELNSVDFSLEEFLGELCEIGRVRAEQKGLAFRYEPRSELPAAVSGDERLLRQVLLNLLGNAAKFTDRGSVVFRVHASPVAAGSTRLVFEVEDTGIGIDAARLDEIFEPFLQAHEAERREEGTGLGLAISRRLVAIMDGTLEVTSTPNQGSTFRVMVELSERESLREATRERPLAAYRGPRRRLLLVDDKAENRAVLAGLLQPLGFELEEAEHGAQALERLRDRRFDAVLLDLVMPVMDGFEVARRIRREAALSPTVIIALSASVFEHDRHESLRAGCHDFLPKPVQARRLYDTLATHLAIDWIYADREHDPGAPAHADGMGPDGQGSEAEPAPLAVPGAAAIEEMRGLAREGDVIALRSTVEKLARLDPTLVPFLREVERMADGYDMERVDRYLRRHLDQEADDVD